MYSIEYYTCWSKHKERLFCFIWPYHELYANSNTFLIKGGNVLNLKLKPIHYTLNVNTKVIFVIITKRKHLNWTNIKIRKNKYRHIYLYSYLEQKDCVRIGSCECVSYHMLEFISCYGTFSYLSPFRQCRFHQRSTLDHNCKYITTIFT